MNDWMANAMPLLPGARNAPVGTPSGMTDASSAKWGTNRAGNSDDDSPALGANRSPSPNETKWSRHAVSDPVALNPPRK